jgi:hypothetical protein
LGFVNGIVVVVADIADMVFHCRFIVVDVVVFTDSFVDFDYNVREGCGREVDLLVVWDLAEVAVRSCFPGRERVGLLFSLFLVCFSAELFTRAQDEMAQG